MTFFTTFKVFVQAGSVATSPVKPVPTNAAAPTTNHHHDDDQTLGESADGYGRMRPSSRSINSGDLGHTSFSMDTFLTADITRLEAESAAGRLAGRRLLLSPWSSENRLYNHDIPPLDWIGQDEDGSETMVDPDDGFDNMYDSGYD
ncbi:hypothetical protein AA313_de0202650 [Arthrobotrys entomopaga]|nr:hypothetical protein AA313_de0202650 [Arthrobotrys entomopaga]